MRGCRPLRMAMAALLASSVVSPLSAADTDGSFPPGYQPSAATDEGGLWMLSAQAEREVQRSPLLVRDKALNDYVSGLVCKLAGPNCKSIRVYVLNIPLFNANMSPNGAMQVWTGLLLRARNEAQLAFVLSHEISHYTHRHTLNRYQSTRDTANALTFLTVATGGIVGGVASLIAAGSLSSYSRDQEREADARGFDIIVANRYDPEQGAAIWRQLDEEQKANPKREKEDPFLASHPTTEERLRTMTERAAEIESQRHDWRDGRDDYLRVIRPFRAQWLEAELGRGQFGETQALLDRLLKDDPGAADLRFYKAELYRRQGDNKSALDAYRQVIAGGGAPLAAYRGLGLVALKLKDKIAAREAFTQYLALAPQADDRSMIEYYMSRL